MPIATDFRIIVASFFCNQPIGASCDFLAAFCGQFLYIGAASLLPETYRHVAWKIGRRHDNRVILNICLTAINKI